MVSALYGRRIFSKDTDPASSILARLTAIIGFEQELIQPTGVNLDSKQTLFFILVGLVGGKKVIRPKFIPAVHGIAPFPSWRFLSGRGARSAAQSTSGE